MIITLRPALHGALLEAVGMDAITLEVDVTGFTVAGSRVTLQTARGDIAEGDMLIGADGVSSVIRRALHPAEPPPRSSGIVAVRGAVHGALPHLGSLHAVYYLGRGLESMLVRASDTGIYWFLSMARELVPATMQDPRSILTLMSPQFDSTFRAVTSATEDLRFDELVDRDPIPYWGRDIVTLLGDAAHPVLPHTGQGAAQAIVDAVALGGAEGGQRRGARVARVRRRTTQQDGRLAAAGTPHGTHHGDDKCAGLLPARSGRPDDSSQAVRKVLCEDQPPRRNQGRIDVSDVESK